MQLATLLAAVVHDPKQLPAEAQALILGLKADKKLRVIAEALSSSDAVIVSGAMIENHPHAALLRTLISLIAEHSGAKQLHLTTGANSAGAALVGMLPHRGMAGKTIDPPGLDVQAALAAKLKGYLLLNAEPHDDFANPSGARQALLGAEFVVAISAFQHDGVQEYADVILPM